VENKPKHLEFIQGVINRLSTNSFLLKGWSVVLVSALFALSAPDSRAAFVYRTPYPYTPGSLRLFPTLTILATISLRSTADGPILIRLA